MSEPSSTLCQNTTICSSSRTSEDIILHVKEQIETCIPKYMSLAETMTYLQDNHQITPNLTKLIWKKLEEESPEFFRSYYKRCETARQINTFNNLFVKQISLMLHDGTIDLSKAKPELVAFLSKHSYGVRIMENLAKKNAYMPEAVPPSSALSVPNGYYLTAQLQIPTNQRNHYQLSIPNAIPYNNCLGAPTIRPTSTISWCTSNNRARTGAPIVAQAALAPLGPSIFPHMDTYQIVRQSEIQAHEVNRKYQMSIHLQQNISQIERPTLQSGISNEEGGSNKLQYISSIDQQSYHNFDPNQKYTNVGQQQSWIMTHYPEEPKLSLNQLTSQSQPHKGSGIYISTRDQPKRRRVTETEEQPQTE